MFDLVKQSVDQRFGCRSVDLALRVDCIAKLCLRHDELGVLFRKEPMRLFFFAPGLKASGHSDRPYDFRIYVFANPELVFEPLCWTCGVAEFDDAMLG